MMSRNRKNQRPLVYIAVLLISFGFFSATCRTFDEHLDDILQELHQISGAVVKHDQLAAARAVKCSGDPAGKDCSSLNSEDTELQSLESKAKIAFEEAKQMAALGPKTALGTHQHKEKLKPRKAKAQLKTSPQKVKQELGGIESKKSKLIAQLKELENRESQIKHVIRKHAPDIKLPTTPAAKAAKAVTAKPQQLNTAKQPKQHAAKESTKEAAESTAESRMDTMKASLKATDHSHGHDGLEAARAKLRAKLQSELKAWHDPTASKPSKTIGLMGKRYSHKKALHAKRQLMKLKQAMTTEKQVAAKAMARLKSEKLLVKKKAAVKAHRPAPVEHHFAKKAKVTFASLRRDSASDHDIDGPDFKPDESNDPDGPISKKSSVSSSFNDPDSPRRTSSYRQATQRHQKRKLKSGPDDMYSSLKTSLLPDPKPGKSHITQFANLGGQESIWNIMKPDTRSAWQKSVEDHPHDDV